MKLRRYPSGPCLDTPKRRGIESPLFGTGNPIQTRGQEQRRLRFQTRSYKTSEALSGVLVRGGCAGLGGATERHGWRTVGPDSIGRDPNET